MSENTEALLDLAVPRTIVLHDRGHVFTIHTRRVEKKDWLAFFAAVVMSTELVNGQRVNVNDFETPRLVLAENVITGAEGYKVAGGTDLFSLPDWVQRIPLAHRRQIGSTLADCGVSSGDGEFYVHAESEEVSLDAVWGMQKFRGVKHILKTPTQAQYKRYNAESSRSRIVGGSRSGKTIYSGAHALLVDLYDELIVSVAGYCWGSSRMDSKAEIVEHMDTHHKFMAAQELFNPSGNVTTEAAAE